MTEPAYEVLARKYRPQTLADLIGQETLVRTLRNAFAADRIAHAFVLTGIRGTGKTTTARIIAKGLNCVGADGAGGATTDPCGVCEPCLRIAEGRYIDVLEIDAASNTGVDAVRELNRIAESKPAGRFRVFIIDEAHMLSTSAFNAMLKTLEEPLPHTKFILATTEIRKVPVTVLSRCQRFDLRRIEPEAMMAMLSRIADAEGVAVEAQALALITRAAEGSARDAQSLLDQAIAQGSGETTAAEVREMLGLADQGRSLDLFDLVMRGDAAGALAALAELYADGADPVAVLNDLAEIAHRLSVLKVAPDAAEDPTLAPDIRTRGREMAGALSMRVLTRAWQMLLKALEEAAAAPSAMMAAEMAVIRLTHVADLPTPGDLVRRLEERPAAAASPAPPPPPADPAPAPTPSAGARAVQARTTAKGTASVAAAAAEPAFRTALARFARFENVLELIRANRDVGLLVEVEEGVRLISYAPGRIEFAPASSAAPDLAQRLGRRLQGWTGVRWAISVRSQGGAPTLAERRGAERTEVERAARTLPLVQAVLAEFPDARVAVRAPEALPPPPEDDDWDPLEG